MRRSIENDRVRFVSGWFRSEAEILAAADAARIAGIEIHDAFTPYPVHGMDDAVGLKRSRLTRVALAGGLAGLALALGLQYWVSLVNWPMNIGGKPWAPLPLFVPVSFELTVLISGLSTVAAFLVISRLRPLKRAPQFDGATDDRFVLVLRHGDASHDSRATHHLLAQHNATRIVEG